MGIMVHVCNTSYLGGGGSRILSLRSARAPWLDLVWHKQTKLENQSEVSLHLHAQTHVYCLLTCQTT